MKCWLNRFVVGTLMLSAVGCGHSGQVEVYPVHGQVKFAGKPMVGGGAIAFIPTANQSGKSAGGRIKEDGTYTLDTYSSGDGSMPGDFRVVVMQEVFREPQASPDGSAPTPAATPDVPEADRIPAIYSDHQRSPLTAKVEAKPNEINFDLQRQ
jgi:hypothetical protein